MLDPGTYSARAIDMECLWGVAAMASLALDRPQ